MCIFCGGACGGAGDILLPSLAAGTSLLAMRIRLSREAGASDERSVADEDQSAESPDDN